MAGGPVVSSPVAVLGHGQKGGMGVSIAVAVEILESRRGDWALYPIGVCKNAGLDCAVPREINGCQVSAGVAARLGAIDGIANHNVGGHARQSDSAFCIARN